MSEILTALVVASLASVCFAVGPFNPLIDDRTSPQPYYDVDGTNSSFREGDIKIDSAGALIGEAASVGTAWKGGRIPYVIDCSIKKLPAAISSLNEAIEEWHARTCIRFVPKSDDDEHYVTFLRSAGCWASYVGYRKRNSEVSIGYGCEYKHVMVHELGHVIGFWHEQSRPDRDKYVRVIESNIIPNLLYNFDKVTEKTYNHGEEYDYGSIMHYPLNAFAINRRRQTLVPRQSLNGKQPYVKLSDSDVAQANKMYDCATAGDLQDTRQDDKCVDRHKDCALWAKHNHCELNPEPLLIYCQKSCDNCGPCVDKSANCPKTYNYLLCNRKAATAFRDCKVVCEYCEPDPTQPPPTTRPTTLPTTQATTTPTVPVTEPLLTQSPPLVIESGEIAHPVKEYIGILCVDRSDNCAEWKKSGRCKTDEWVKRNCLVSCNRDDICDTTAFKPSGSCASPLGLGLGNKNVKELPDSSFRASSHFVPGGGWSASPARGRLYITDDHTKKKIGAWCAEPRQAKTSVLLIDLLKAKKVTGIATQGRDVYFEHVRMYEISYKQQSGDRWQKYTVDGEVKVFTGNCDHVTPVLNIFKNPIPAARFIRIEPKTYRGTACLRVELYGC